MTEVAGEATNDGQAGRTLVTIATYNESENLESLVHAIFQNAPDVDILVVDDNSPDGTGEIADRLAAANPRVHVIHRSGKLGLGTATIAAIQWAFDRPYAFVLNLDADFSHHPRYIPDLLRGMAEHDVMIGSRYVPGGRIEGWDAKRKVMSWCINTYTRLLLGLKTRDCSGAFRCYRLSKLREIDYARIYSRGYSFQEEFLYHCERVGCRLGETPIVFENRRSGHSKISLKEALKALWCLFYTALRRG